jgi:hypothetical protein
MAIIRLAETILPKPILINWISIVIHLQLLRLLLAKL